MGDKNPVAQNFFENLRMEDWELCLVGGFRRQFYETLNFEQTTKTFKLEQIMIVQTHADDEGNGEIFVFFQKNSNLH